MFDSFLGNEQLKKELESLLKSDSLYHGIVIQGEEGEGGGYLAKLIASEYLGDRNGLVLRGVHPDCILVEGTGASGSIAVQTIRDVLYEANKAAVTADGRRVVLIRRAENLNASSSNALLKMLEEPPAGVLFLLTVRKRDDLLPTILSRTAFYSVQSLSKEVCVDEILKRVPGVSAEKAEEIAELFDGRLGLSLRTLSDPEYAAFSELGKSFCDAAMKGDRFGILRDLSEATDRSAMKLLLQTAAIRLRRRLRSADADPECCSMVMERITEAYYEITNNANIKLVQTRLGYKLAKKRT